MTFEIDAIFLDVGNTLRILTKDAQYQMHAQRRITELLGTAQDPQKFCCELDLRYKQYRKWAFDHLKEAPEIDLWQKWLAPEFSDEITPSKAIDLTYQYRQSMGFRVMVPNGAMVIRELHARDYRLGLISNVITSQEIPDWLDKEQLTPYFSSVALSSQLGIRKPDPQIYHIAAQRAGVAPHRCVYVGDNLDRDVSGTRQAGFGMVIILQDKRENANLEIDSTNLPDVIIQDFDQLLEIFPARPQVELPLEKRLAA